MVKTINSKPNDKTTTRDRHISVSCNICQAPSLAQRLAGENTSEAVVFQIGGGSTLYRSQLAVCVCFIYLFIDSFTRRSPYARRFGRCKWNLEHWSTVNDVHSLRPLKFHAIYNDPVR